MRLTPMCRWNDVLTSVVYLTMTKILEKMARRASISSCFGGKIAISIVSMALRLQKRRRIRAGVASSETEGFSIFFYTIDLVVATQTLVIELTFSFFSHLTTCNMNPVPNPTENKPTMAPSPTMIITEAAKPPHSPNIIIHYVYSYRKDAVARAQLSGLGSIDVLWRLERIEFHQKDQQQE